MSLLGLFGTFFYIGAFTIGGGLVAISLMQQELVGRGLISVERFYNMVAISESTPGPIGINMATYIGYEMYGVWGGFITTLGTVLPSWIVIIAIAMFFGSFQEKPLVQSAFYGLRAGSTGMIAVAAWQVLRIAVFTFTRFRASGSYFDIINIPAFILFVSVGILNAKFKWHPILFIIIGAIFGFFFM